ncbi:hypothetical protein D3C78_1553450 [compost metagenome]
MRLGRQLLLQLDDKAKAQERRVVRRDPLVQFEERLRRGANAGFFPQLAFGGLNQGFVGFKMTGRLVPECLAVNGLFDD